MNPALKAAWSAEMTAAQAAAVGDDLNRAFHHYERAHILGQRHTWCHVQAHIGLLMTGYRRRDAREIAGQLSRIVAATLFSKIWVPMGNTGGANVSAFKPMPLPTDLKNLIEGG